MPLLTELWEIQTAAARYKDIAPTVLIASVVAKYCERIAVFPA